MTSLLDMEYPVQTIWHNYEMPLENNDTLVWVGQAAVVIDANGRVFNAPGLEMDTAWYHCAHCLHSGQTRFSARASMNSRFCANCGSRLDWGHLTVNDAAKVAVQDEIDAKIAAANANTNT